MSDLPNHFFEIPNPPHEDLTTLPNWFKRSLKRRSQQLASLKALKIRRCDVCEQRFIPYFNDNKSGFFQASDCASWIFESHGNVWLTTSYGSDFDGDVFLFHKAHKINQNCCDACIIAFLKSKEIEYAYNYFDREFNPKFKKVVVGLFDGNCPLSPASDKSIDYQIKYLEEICKRSSH